MNQKPLIALTDRGLYCEAGDFYIDPHKVVDLAIITHAHSDHARRGSRKYICEKSGVGLLKSRIGSHIHVESFAYRETFNLGPVKVSLHSAGHILGSAQVRIELDGEVWVVSGDYKRDTDPSCEPFESVKCDTFITEATFGTPKYVWQKNQNHGEAIAKWWKENEANAEQSILFGYSLGKAQRILAELAPYAHKPVLIYKTITELTNCYRAEGRKLAETKDLDSHDCFSGELILAPPSVLTAEFIKKIGPHRTAFASGWMADGTGHGFYGRGAFDHGFIISDHADWNDLNQTIEETGAGRVFVQHRKGTLISHLKKKGLDAHPIDELVNDKYARLGGITPRLL